MIASGSYVKKHKIEPIARLVNYSVAGLPPRIMGVGPIKAIRTVLEKTDLNNQLMI